jgi:hypothetical protein
LTHSLIAIRSQQNWQRKTNLWSLTEYLLELSARHEVEKLFLPAYLHIRFEEDRVVGLHQSVEELVKPDRVLSRIALSEAMAGEELLNREVGG